MKIALLTHRYPLPEKPHLLSDVDALHHITEYWARDGHEVHVVVLYQHQNDHSNTPKPFFYRHFISEIVRDGVHIHLVETRFIHKLAPLNFVYFALLGKKAARIVGKSDLTLVHFPSRMFSFAEAFHPAKDKICVLHITDVKRLAQKNREGRALRERIPREYAAIGFRSAALQRAYHEILSEGKREFLVLSGAPFTDCPAKIHPEGRMKVIYVGKLIARKQAAQLVRALSRMEGDWELTIVGEGEQRKNIESLIAEKGLEDRVTMTGNVPREKVMEYMADSDVFVLQSYDETFGIVYLEAMAQRLICIGSRGEGVDGTIVDGENGFLVDARSEDELLDALKRVAAMPETERERLRAAAYETARTMTEEGMARRYLELAAK